MDKEKSEIETEEQEEGGEVKAETESGLDSLSHMDGLLNRTRPGRSGRPGSRNPGQGNVQVVFEKYKERFNKAEIWCERIKIRQQTSKTGISFCRHTQAWLVTDPLNQEFTWIDAKSTKTIKLQTRISL